MLAKVAAKLPHGVNADGVAQLSFRVDQTSRLPCDCCIVMFKFVVLTSAPQIVFARLERLSIVVGYRLLQSGQNE